MNVQPKADLSDPAEPSKMQDATGGASPGNPFLRVLAWLDGLILAAAGDPRRTLLLLVSWAVFLSLIQVEAVVLSLAGTAIGQPRAMLILLTSAAGGLLFHNFLSRKIPRPASSGFSPSPSSARDSRTARIIGRLVTVAGAVFIVFLAGFAWHNPDVSWDGMTYHVPPVHFWTLKGHLCWVEVYPPYTLRWLKGNGVLGGRADLFMNGYPKAVELVSYILVGAFRHDQFLSLANLAFYPLAILGIIALARLFGAAPFLAAAAGFLFPFVPVVVAQSVTTYNDVGLAAAIIGLMALAARGCSAALRRSLNAVEVTGFGALAGLTLGVKFTGVPLVGLALALLALALGLGWFRSRPRALGGLVRPAATLAGAVLAAFAVAGYWYVRNWAIAGNPLFPVQVKFFGHVFFDGIPANDVLLLGGNSGGAWRRILTAWLQTAPGKAWPETIRPYDSQFGGLGFLWLYGCVPAILLYTLDGLVRLVRRRLDPITAPRIVAFSVAVCLTLVLFAMTPGNHIVRYVLWIHGVGLASLAAVASGLMRRAGGERLAGRCARVAIGLVFLAGAALLACEGSLVYGFNRAFYATLMGYQKKAGQPPQTAWTPYDIAVSGDGAFRSIPLMEEIMRANVPVAYGAFPSHTQGMYTPGILAHPIGERPVHYIDIMVLNDARRFNEFIQRTHVRYIILDGVLFPQAPGSVAPQVRATSHNAAYTVLALQ